MTSNVRTGAVARLEDHPVCALHKAGVPITINTDDPALFGTTLSKEYAVAARLGLGDPTEAAFEHSFGGGGLRPQMNGRR